MDILIYKWLPILRFSSNDIKPVYEKYYLEIVNKFEIKEKKLRKKFKSNKVKIKEEMVRYFKQTLKEYNLLNGQE